VTPPPRQWNNHEDPLAKLKYPIDSSAKVAFACPALVKCCRLPNFRQALLFGCPVIAAMCDRPMTRMKDNHVQAATGQGLDAATRDRFALLLERVAAFADRTAYAELFSYYTPRVKSFLLRMGCSDAQAEELSQDVMVNVWRKARQFDRRQASVGTWIFRIARNRRIDIARRDNKPALDEHEPALQPTELAQPDVLVSLSQIETSVRAALSELPAEQADLVRAAYYEGLSQSEIAKRYDMPLGTVKSRIRLAFEKLRSRLGTEEL